MGSLKVLSGFLAVLALAGIVAAQGPPTQRPERTRPDVSDEDSETGSVRGRILLPNGAPVSETVKLTLQSYDGTQVTIYTDINGQFDFGRVRTGNYELQTEADRERFAPVSQRVQVFTGYPAILTVTLKEKAAARAPRPPADSGPVVAAAELEQKVPEKARKEFERATSAFAAGRREESIARLQKAVAIFPDYLMARNDLGAQLMEAGRLDEAAEHLRHAVSVSPKSFNPLLNLGILHVRRQEFAEAARLLEEAAAFNPRSAAARLHAGIARAALGEHERAERDLKAAYDLGGAGYADALYHLGQLYLGRGERELALKSFETYLGVAPRGVYADQARVLIKALR